MDSRLKEILQKKIKGRGDLNEGDPVYNAADELNERRKEVFDEIKQEFGEVNRSVHYSPTWLDYSGTELRNLLDMFRRLSDLLYCNECGSTLLYQELGNIKELRCNCGDHLDLRWG